MRSSYFLSSVYLLQCFHNLSFIVFHFAETGLEGMLFSMLDMETDDKLRTNIHDTLISMLHELAGEDLARWLLLCKAVLAASTGKLYLLMSVK